MVRLDFTEEQIVRYSRQIVLPEVGGIGQKKINDGRVLIAGAGGLGSPAAYYLAAAGVGTIGIIDCDAVDLSNLQRQILHTTKDIGKPKVDSAKEKLNALNPDCNVVPHWEKLTAQNINEIIRDYDVIVDGVDNFPTRYLVNDACVMAGKIFVHGGVLGFTGQTFTVIPGKGPCLRCILREPPPPGSVPSCSEAGVLGVLAGTIGIIQATEVLKYLLGKGDLLVGRLIAYNALDMKFKEIQVRRDPDCPVCGDNPTITGLTDDDLPGCAVKERRESY
ncbi:MAG: putative adenylyltransferase/sulfurtransferase MoeZ [Pelotomaculum sp. PtaB.Bin013]|nr:MAG: putative adenylyltransferase/sulfurtransferase MoeZ [Pelotomaculum sp. PtaB.Bin013]